MKTKSKIILFSSLGGLTVIGLALGLSLSLALPSSASTSIGGSSALKSGLYRGSSEKIDLVGLGDSITKGYTTLSYKDGDVPRDNKSYFDYVADLLRQGSVDRLGSAHNLAQSSVKSGGDVSGAKAADVLKVLDDSANGEILKNGDVFMITVGANDILPLLKVAGLDTTDVGDLLSGDYGTILNGNLSPAYELLGPYNRFRNSAQTVLPSVLGRTAYLDDQPAKGAIAGLPTMFKVDHANN